MVQVNIDFQDLERCVGIDTDIQESNKTELVKFLQQNASTFAWSNEDILRIDPTVSCHELNVGPAYIPIK